MTPTRGHIQWREQAMRRLTPTHPSGETHSHLTKLLYPSRVCMFMQSATLRPSSRLSPDAAKQCNSSQCSLTWHHKTFARPAGPAPRCARCGDASEQGSDAQSWSIASAPEMGSSTGSAGPRCFPRFSMTHIVPGSRVRKFQARGSCGGRGAEAGGEDWERGHAVIARGT